MLRSEFRLFLVNRRIVFSRGFEAGHLLTGLRGKPPADVDALCDAIVKVSNLAVSLGEQLLALDINPFVVHATNHGVVAVDALVQIGKMIENWSIKPT